MPLNVSVSPRSRERSVRQPGSFPSCLLRRTYDRTPRPLLAFTNFGKGELTRFAGATRFRACTQKSGVHSPVQSERHQAGQPRWRFCFCWACWGCAPRRRG